MNNVMYTSSSVEWYTPRHITDKVLQVFGTIDLDPCSNPGEPNIPAKNHFRKEDDGLKQEWFGKTYVNPPYGRSIRGWTTKLDNEYHGGNIDEAILLVPARTDTKWFNDIADHAVCLVRGRVHFSNCSNSAPFPSAVFYFGDNTGRFVEEFKDLGNCMNGVRQSLSYTRHCSRCGEEYDARVDSTGRIKDYYCGNCRNNFSSHYKHTDAFRVNNREYMKKYRAKSK